VLTAFSNQGHQSMSTTFFLVSDNSKIGMRGAAGLYCWKCNVTLCADGNKAILAGTSNWLQACPKCGESRSDKLGPAYDTGSNIQTVCLFQWFTRRQNLQVALWHPHNDHPIVDDRGGKYTLDEFNALVKACPIQFHWEPRELSKTTPAKRSAIFKDIPDEVYVRVLGRLNELRRQYPDYRDDQLLMYALCHDVIGRSCVII
jgi:hypothetical protein